MEEICDISYKNVSKIIWFRMIHDHILNNFVAFKL